MATTVAKAFEEFASLIKPTEAQEAVIASRRKAVEGFMLAKYGQRSNMPLLETTVIGSAGRKTLIRPVEDIDIFCVFDDSNVWPSYKRNSQELLYRIREALADYQVRTVGARGQAVRLFYTDGPNVDVTPAFRNYEPIFGQRRGFVIPKGDKRWQATDPYKHAEFMSQRNQELGNHLKPLVRKLKRWNRAHSSRLGSFHFGLLVQATLASLNSNSRDAARVFFENAGTYLHVKDPAGYSGDLAASMTYAQQAAIKQSFATALQHVRRAQTAEVEGKVGEALKQWRLVFGDEFPGYTPPARLNLSPARPR